MTQSLRQHKGIRYSKDLNSLQVWEVMNSILREAAAPLCVYAGMGVETALSCVSISTKNRRRISVYENAGEFMELLCNELCRDAMWEDESSLDLLDLLLQKGVEKNIIVDHITFSLQTSSFPGLDRGKLYRHVGLYLDAYDEFKRDVLFRFYYFIQSNANRNHFVKNLHGLKSTKDDMFHVYVISSMRAIDRFIPDKGTLADYIETWFKNAEGSSDFITYDGEAFSLNRAVRKEVQTGAKQINNKAIPLHDRENSIAMVEEETLDQGFEEYSRLLATLQSSTIVFLAQNLPFTLSHEQKRTIAKHNANVLKEEKDGPK